jgi:pilus assembly protein CpaF
VLVNRPDRVLLERSGQIEVSEKAFSSDQALRQVIDRLVAATGRRIDEATPLLDVRLRDGTRVTAAASPLAVRGACLTLRKPRRATIGLDELVRVGTLSPAMAEFLGTCITARRNIIVCGGPGSGKTAFLASLAGLVAAGERVVSIEEVAELSLARDQWIALEARPAGPDGQGGVSLADTLRAAMRMRPDRLVVGEVRGTEAYPLVAAMASANDGTLASIVAEGPRAALGRLESLARLELGDGAGRALRELVSQGAHIVVSLTRYADGVRRVASIAEVGGIDGDGYAIRDLFHFQVQGTGDDGRLRGRFAGAGIVPRFYEALEARGIAADPALFR